MTPVDLYAPTKKEEYEKSEKPAILLLEEMGYEYKNQTGWI